MSSLLILIGNFIANSIVKLFFAILEKSPEWLVGRIFDRLSPKDNPKTPKEMALIDPHCGDQGIDLHQQRLKISAAFGSYLTGLLEKDQSYVSLKGQVDLGTPAQGAVLDPFQSILWNFYYARGPQVVLIAAEGGMGKSTLAAKIVRCLYAENAIDILLGDSAKTQEVDPVSGVIQRLNPAYYDLDTFLKHLCSQLGLNYVPGRSNQQRALGRIRDRLEGRHAVIVVDNLETVQNGADLLNAMRLLTNRDVRVLVTTRTVSEITTQTPGIFLIHLRPIQEVAVAREFLTWHIRARSQAHPGLTGLEKDIEDKGRVRLLLEKTGGIPLLMQLTLSDVARTSWERLDHLPNLFGKELLNFLYQERWAELDQIGVAGKDAQALLFHVRQQMYRGKVTYRELVRWADEMRYISSADIPIHLLTERFLLVNSDSKQGNFSLFPSLVEFLDTQKVA